MGLVGATADDTEAELVRNICEMELLDGKICGGRVQKHSREDSCLACAGQGLIPGTPYGPPEPCHCEDL